MERIRVALNNSVIGKRYCPVSPGEGSLYDLLGLRNSVHIAHLGMDPEFHSLFARIVFSGCAEIIDLNDPLNIAENKISSVELAVTDIDKSCESYERSGLKLFRHNSGFRLINIYLAAYGISEIGDIERYDGSVRIPQIRRLYREHHSLYGDCSHSLVQVTERHRLFIGKYRSEDRVGIVHKLRCLPAKASGSVSGILMISAP